MSKHRKFSWPENIKAFKSPLEAIVKICQRYIPPKSLEKSTSTIMQAKNTLHQAYEDMILSLAKLPFIAIFLVWLEDPRTTFELANNAKLLLEMGFIGIQGEDGKTWTIADAHEFDHNIIIDAIRCNQEINQDLQETFVATYLSFLHWLSMETYGYFPECKDPDLLRTANRVLAHSLFIKFIDKLSGEKERLVAKLLYFGGTRTLDEILKVDLKNVDFDKRVIQYGFYRVSYPAHVFADIQKLAGKKKTGRLFIGRKNAPLSPPTIFRNFKQAATEVGLGQTFGPAILTAST